MVRFVVLWVLGLSLTACAGGTTRAPEAPAGGESDAAAANGEAHADATADSITERLIARIRALEPEAQIQRRGAYQLHVSARGENNLLSLENLHRGCRNAPAACADRIDAFAHMAVLHPDDPPRLEQVLPTLKACEFVVQAEQTLRSKGQTEPLLSFALLDDLCLVLVLDTPMATRMLTRKDAQALGVEAEALRERALANLRQRSSGLRFREVAPQLYALSANDGYDSAMFLLHAEWQAVSQQLRGAPVVAPIGRDIVLFAGDTSSAGLDALRLILLAENQHPEAAYPITTQPYRWTPQGWANFQFPAPAPR